MFYQAKRGTFMGILGAALLAALCLALPEWGLAQYIPAFVLPAPRGIARFLTAAGYVLLVMNVP